MFDSRASQIASSYQEFVGNSIHNLRSIGKAIEELLKAIRDKGKEKKEKLSAIDAQIGSEKYRLVPDEECPGAWKWQSAQMTDFQTQTVMKRLACEEAISPGVKPDIGNVEKDASLAIIAHTESGESIVMYHQNQEGNCVTNIVTENLSSSEIIDVVDEVITSSEFEVNSNLIPPASTREEVIEEEKQLISNADESSPELVVIKSDTQGKVKDSNQSPTSSLPSEIKVEQAESTLQDSSALDMTITTTNASQKHRNTQFNEPENTPPRKRSPQVSKFDVGTLSDSTDTEIPTIPKLKPAAEYSYEQIASSKEVSPETKRWVRVVEVPVFKAVANSRVERSRIKQENIKIAQTAVEMLKVYGEETGYGYKVYRSDAFVIKQSGSKYSIHHRRDELNQFHNPLMELSLNSKGKPKIEILPNQMLPVERQEFLMVGERLESGKKLPQLANIDLREVANNLGSLAPAGTFKTLESFRETEMLGLLNSALQKANTDTLTVGEYTISRTRNLEVGRANLSLYKTLESGERKELLAFTLQKTEQGLTKQVDKLSISDWDLNQLKFISENAKAFDLGHTIGNLRGEQQSQESISEIKVPLHPAIQKAWNQLETLDSSKWHSSIRQENERIRQNLQDFGAKLSIAEQRELYFQILAQERLESSAEQIKMPPLKEIMKDLLSWRHEAISHRYSPKEHIPMTQEQTVSRNSTHSRSKEEISL
ncbi:hypothetical protein [Fortiea contorta]|uniref:hypothetical protein n=1 Tax=Fortiea contorta TaxID=1892405 RepID=UPI000345AC10|nr:hypothetical protein [Fortiea contorta]